MHSTSAFSFKRLWVAALILSLVLAGCGSPAAEPPPTAPPSPAPSPTAHPTSTPPPSPTPTLSPTPSPTAPPPTLTRTPTATLTPIVFGEIRSRQRVNVRKGPGVDFSTFETLPSGSEVQVIGQNEDGTWHSIKLDNGDEGWVRADLLFIDRPTPSPTAWATEDPVDEAPMAEAPIVDLESVYFTATALANGSASAENAAATATPPAADNSIEVPTRPADIPRSGVDVFAFCDDSRHGIDPPPPLAAGSTIEIYWAWYASTDAYLQQHIDNASHELRVNDVRIANVDQFRQPAITRGRNRILHWYVPFGPLEAGDYLITYRVAWRTAISDGYESFGPGTDTEFEEESCRFVAR